MNTEENTSSEASESSEASSRCRADKLFRSQGIVKHCKSNAGDELAQKSFDLL